MALKVEIQKSKEVALWKEYKSGKKVLAEFKIRGIGYKAYQVAIERAHNQVSSKGFDVTQASSSDKLLHELHLDAAACHLIEDWKGVILSEDGVETEVPYTPENAMKLFSMGDIGIQIWAWIKTQAEEIQVESNKLAAETVGKP
ncbi:hypothetical protein [Acinetobacter sp. Ver3]|uniref:hypothetical protein n=1 Tax=Acinetobacter sp. Ver3 TaxID=466088 RepID=UPI00044A28C4|nr:hypothetical protein [Acinetobacter sp. Ver3]EZQ10736.1 hypothetical protein CL42_06280 [Acinetobacter sp. Ver3]